MPPLSVKQYPQSFDPDPNDASAAGWSSVGVPFTMLVTAKYLSDSSALNGTYASVSPAGSSVTCAPPGAEDTCSGDSANAVSRVGVENTSYPSAFGSDCHV